MFVELFHKLKCQVDIIVAFPKPDDNFGGLLINHLHLGNLMVPVPSLDWLMQIALIYMTSATLSD
jgi:hypothetical protein